MEKYSSISSIIEKIKKQMLTDSTIKRRVDREADRVSKSQEQIPFSFSIYSLRPASHGIRETFGPLSLVVYYIKWEVP